MWINIDQFIEQHQHIRIKLNPINSYQITKQRSKTFFIWPRGASENMFEVKHLTHLKVGGNVRS